MYFRQWSAKLLKTWFGISKKSPIRRGRSGYRLAVETLEDRLAPAALNSVLNNGPVLVNAPAAVTVNAVSAVSYAFDFDNNGSFEVGPQASNQAQHSFSGAGAYAVTVQARDAGGNLATAAPLSGLVSWWRGDGNSGDSADGNTGTLVNGTSFVPFANDNVKVGSGAFAFDGVNDYVQIGAPANLRMTAALSIDLWFHADSKTAPADRVLVNKEGEYEIGLSPSGQLWYAIANTNPGWTGVNTGYFLPSDFLPSDPRQSWHHISLTYNGSTITTYVDGAVFHSITGSGAIGDYHPAENDFRIGARQFGPPSYFAGRIDEVGVYNRALSSQEVLGLFQAGNRGEARNTFLTTSVVVVEIPVASHLYELNSSLADALGGPSLVSAGGTLGATGYTFGVNQGPSLSSAIDPTSYAVEMVFRLNSTSGWKKLIDFTNRSLDRGIYSVDGKLQVYGGVAAAGPAGSIQPNTNVHLVLNREGSSGLVTAYVNGVLQFTFVDGFQDAVFSSNIAQFLIDDNLTGGNESPTGFLDRVRVFNKPLTSDQVQKLFLGGPVAPVFTGVTNSGPVLQDSAAAVTVDAYNAANYSFDFDNNGTFEVGPQTSNSAQHTYVAPGTYPVTVQAHDSTGNLAVVPSLPGLVSWWRGDGSTGDSAGGSTGTLVNGTTYATGQVGQAFNLKGVNRSVEFTGRVLAPTGSFAIDTWINTAGLGAYQTIVSEIGNENLAGQYQFRLSDTGRLQFFRRTGNLSDVAFVTTTAPIIAADTWTHVAAVYGGSTDFRLYVNGELATTSFAPAVNYVGGASAKTRIGATELGVESFNGLVDEVGLYNRALSGQEVRSLYQAGSRGEARNTFLTTSIVVNPVPNQPPVANGAYMPSFDEDTSFSRTLTGADVNGDALTFALFTSAVHGNVTVASNGTFVYTPNANYHGFDQFQFTVSDGAATSAPAPVYLIIDAVNDAPTLTLAPDTVTLLEDSGPAVLTSFVSTTTGPADESNQTVTDITLIGVSDPSLFSVQPRLESTTAVFTANFDDYKDHAAGVYLQADTDLPVYFAGTVPGWSQSGFHAAHAVERGNGDIAIQLYDLNTLTMNNGIAANNAGAIYQVSFDSAPTTWGESVSGTTAADVVRVEVLRANNTVLATFDHQAGVWSPSANAQDTFHTSSFIYVGDGSGDVRIRFSVATPDPYKFAGAIDNLRVSALERKLIFTPAPNAHGSSTVTFQAQDNGGVANGGVERSAIQTLTIIVNAVNDAPVAAMTSAPTAQEGKPVLFDASDSFDVDGDTLAYSWSFGDGASYTESPANAPDGAYDGKATHGFDDDGSYVVGLTVSDAFGGVSASVTTMVDVENVAPTVSFDGASGTDIEIAPAAFGTFRDQSAPFGTINPGDGFIDGFVHAANFPSFQIEERAIIEFSLQDLTAPVSSASLDLIVARNEGDTGIPLSFGIFVYSGNGTTSLFEGSDFVAGGMAGGFGISNEAVGAVVSIDYTALINNFRNAGYAFVGFNIRFLSEEPPTDRFVSFSNPDGTNAPKLRVHMPANNAVIEGEFITLTGTVTDPSPADTHTATLDWRDGSALENVNVDPVTRTFAASHAYQITGDYQPFLLVTDDDGGQGIQTIAITVEPEPNRPPVVNLYGSIGTEDDGQDQHFDWDVQDADANLSFVQMRVTQNGTQIIQSTNFGGGFNFNSYGPGEFILTVTATDALGATTAASRTVTVIDDDTAAPTIDIGGSRGDETDDRHQEFSWDVRDASGFADLRVTISQGSNIVHSSNAPAGTFNFDSLGMGVFTIDISATDNDTDVPHDELSSHASQPVIVSDDDNFAPQTQFVNAIDQTDGADNIVRWTSDDHSGIAIISAELIRVADGAVLMTSSLPAGSFDLNALPVGTYRLHTLVTDGDNDWTGDALSNHDNATFTISDDDTDAPVIVLGGSTGVERLGARQVFTWDVTDYSSSIVTATLTRNGTIIDSSIALIGEFHFVIFGVGVYQIDVSATDRDADRPGDSLSSDVVSRSVVVTNAAPVALMSSVSTAEEGQSVLFDASGSSDADGDALTYTWSFGEGASYTESPGNAPDGSYDGNTTHVFRDNGFYVVDLTLDDGFGGVSSITTTVTVTNLPPEIRNVSITPSEIDENSTINLSFEVYDVGAVDTRAVTIDWGDGSLSGYPLGLAPSFISTTHRYEDDNASDSYTVLITAIDNDGGTATASRTVIVHNVAPTIVSVTNNGPIAPGVSATITVVASDPAGAKDPLLYEFDFNNDGVYDARNATGTIQHLFAQTGTYPVNVRVSDGDGGVASTSITLPVNSLPSSVQLATIPGSITENRVTTLSGSFVDPDPQDTHHVVINWGDNTSDAFDLAAGVVTFGGRDHHYRNNPSMGSTYAVAAMVTDTGPNGTGSASGSTTVTVDNVPPYNVQLIVSPTAFYEGGSTSLSGSFNDPGILDTHHVVINWGDNTTTALDLAAAVTSFSNLSHTYFDNPLSGVAFTVTATVTETGVNDTGSASGSATLNVYNVAPTAVFNAPITVNEGPKVLLSLTNPSDPSSVDTGAGFRYSFAFDGKESSLATTYSSASSLSSKSSFLPSSGPGTYTVKARIFDKNGGYNTYARDIIVTRTIQFGTPSDDVITGVARDSTGVYVVGYSTGDLGILPIATAIAHQPSLGKGIPDAFLRKYDNSGALLWTNEFGTTSTDKAFGVAVDSSGVYVVGVTYGWLLPFLQVDKDTRGEGDIFVVQFDTSGNTKWTTQVGSTKEDVAYGIATDSNNIYVVGATNGDLGNIYDKAWKSTTNKGGRDAIILSWSKTYKEHLWAHLIGGAGNDVANGIAVDSTGVYVAGQTDGSAFGGTSAGGTDAFVRKYDLTGGSSWSNQFGTASHDTVNSVVADGTGVYVAGSTDGTLPGQTRVGNTDAFVRKYGPNGGSPLWTDQFGTAGSDAAFGIGRYFSGGSGVVVVGQTAGALSGTNQGGADVFVREYDLTGVVKWMSQFGSSSGDKPRSVVSDSTGVYVAGSTTGSLPGGSNAGGSDAFFTKLVVNKNYVNGGASAVNGYLVGSTAFFDANLNGELDSDEPWALTGATGAFEVQASSDYDSNGNGVLDDGEGQWVVLGGIDSSTGLPAVNKLMAPASWSVVTPLSTLVSTLTAHYPLSLADAKSRVVQALGLPDVDLSTMDPIAQTMAGDPIAPAVFAAHAQVQDTIAQMLAVLVGAGGAPPREDLEELLMADLAAKIVTSDATLNLSDAAVLEAILRDVASSSGVALDDGVVAGAADVIAAANQLIDAIPVTSDLAYLLQVAQVKAVSQGVVVAQLTLAAQGDLDITVVVDNNTGAALATRVAASFTPPTIVIPAEIFAEATGAAGASVSFDIIATNLVGQSVGVICTPSSGDLFPVGTTTVFCSATDSDGHTGFGSFLVTVTDTVAPVLTLPASRIVKVNVLGGAIVSFEAPMAVDLVDPNPVIGCSATAGFFPIGTTTVDCTATDAAGNATSASFTITVVLEFPEVTVDHLAVTVDEGQTATNSGAFVDRANTGAMTIDASIGTITQSANDSGVWTWSADAQDGPLDHAEIIITATDGAGTSYATRFSVSVNNVLPEFDAGPDTTLRPRVAGAFVRSGITFTDPGLDAWTGTVDYGDGSVFEDLAINQATKSFDLHHIYTLEGTYEVTITINDGAANATDSFLVTVQLNTPPVARDDDITTDEDHAVTFNVFADNGHGADVDAEGNIDARLTVALSLPSHGLLTNNGDGTFRFDPTGAFDYLAFGESATVGFGYQIQDSFGESSSAVVTISITGVNDAPTVGAPIASGASEDDPAFSVNLLAGASDPDSSDILRVRNLALISGNAAGVTTSGNSLSIDTAAYNYLASGASEVIVYRYDVDDGHGGSVAQTATITITGQNDAPVLTLDVTGGVTEEAASPNLTDSGTLNVTDADMTDSHIVSTMYNGDAVWTGGTLTAAQITAISSGFTADSDSWDYSVANANVQFLGAGETIRLSFNVIVTDDFGAANNSDTKTVTITINGANDDPTITAGSTDADGAVTEDTGVTLGNLTDSGTIAFNDVDLIDMHTTSVAADPGNTLGGTLKIGPVSESATTELGTVGWSYTVVNSVTQYLAAGQTATEKFTVTIDDGNGGKVHQVVTVTITGVNEPSSVTVTWAAGASTPYDGNQHGATASWASDDGASGFLGVTYYAASDLTHALSGAPSSAGSFVAMATFGGDTGHDGNAGSANFTINQVGSTVALAWADGTCTNYDGHQHSAIASWASTGADGEHGTLTVNYYAASDLVHALPSAPTNAGSYIAVATYAGDTNHTGSSSTANFTINKATLTGFASTQAALNIAKQGALSFSLGSFTGLQGNDTLATMLSTAVFSLKIGVNTYSFAPIVSLNASTNTVSITYSLQNGGHAGLLAADLQALDVSDGVNSTSASNASVQAIWVCMTSDNYTFTDDALTKLFNSTK